MLPITKDDHPTLWNWLWLAVGALAVAGLFAILLVAARSPVVQEMIPLTDVFHKALTVHVNLSVLVWFLSMACVFWQMLTPSRAIDKPIFYGAVVGVVIFVLSPFLQEGKAYLNNYVPILDNQPFIWGVGIFLSAVMVQAIVTVMRYFRIANNLFHYAIFNSALIYICAFVAFILSYIHLSDPEIDFGAAQFYESFFWGGGHILQFLYTQTMLLAWWWLSGFKPQHSRVYTIIFSLNLLFAAGSLATYALYPAYAPEHITIFTNSMKYFGGVAAIAFGLPLLRWCFNQWQHIPLRWLLAWSIFMFGAGGALGFMIHGVNTVIPAHYHGSIVGVTLALMGMVYTVLPKLGYPLRLKRILTLQPFIYGIGQLLHIVGLAWSGGYGALRKTPGAMESFEGQTAMGLMGLGGLLSIIGGVLFVFLCIHALCCRNNKV